MRPLVLEPLPCLHEATCVQIKGTRAICSDCHSFFDLRALETPFTYDDSYPLARDHFNSDIGTAKIHSLERWLKKTRIDVSKLSVCEVGFGAGQTLGYLQKRARSVWGIEAIAKNRQHVIALGLPADHILPFEHLLPPLPETIDLWIFLDSFEHLTRPNLFMPWLVANSSRRARALIVAPRADSFSQRLMGPAWPHRVPDHPFHWSLRGLTDFFRRFGFTPVHSFFPWKQISFPMLMAHLRHKLGRPESLHFVDTYLPRWGFRFNIGEMGLVLSRD